MAARVDAAGMFPGAGTPGGELSGAWARAMHGAHPLLRPAYAPALRLAAGALARLHHALVRAGPSAAPPGALADVKQRMRVLLAFTSAGPAALAVVDAAVVGELFTTAAGIGVA